MSAGCDVDVLLERPGFVSATVRRGADVTKIEWVHDSAWRFLPTVKNETSGFQLHPVDLAINKLLALVGRNEPRDFLDTVDADQRILSLGGDVAGRRLERIPVSRQRSCSTWFDDAGSFGPKTCSDSC